MKDLNSITIGEAMEAYEKFGIRFELSGGKVIGYAVENEFEAGENEVPGERMTK